MKYFWIVLALVSSLVFAAGVYYVNQNYDTDDTVNSISIQGMGYHLSGKLKPGNYYHFKFKDGVIKRFYYTSPYVSLKFLPEGDITQWELTPQDFRDLAIRFPYASTYADSIGGASIFGSTSFASRLNGYNNQGVVIIEECDGGSCEEVH